jgi:hypothetical protein
MKRRKRLQLIYGTGSDSEWMQDSSNDRQFGQGLLAQLNSTIRSLLYI